MNKHTIWASPRDNYLVSIDGTAMRLEHKRKHLQGSVEVDRVYRQKMVESNRPYSPVSFGRGEQRKMHRLVAELFIEGRTDINNQVLHRDDNPHNNTIENLYWGSYEDNLNDSIVNNKRVYKVHANCAKAKFKPLLITKGAFRREFKNIKEAIVFLGVGASAVSQALKNGRPTAGYKVELI